MPPTSRALAVHPVTLREVEVSRIEDITPGMRRVTFTGAQLRAFTSDNGLPQPDLVSGGFDDDIRLLFAHPGQSEPVLPVQAQGKLDWAKDARPLYRAYTVRRYDPGAGELDVDVVRHGVGVAATWADRAEPGDRIHFFGPHSSSGPPPPSDWLLVAGDETALPAIGRLLEEAPADTRAQVFVEVAERSHVQPLRELPGVTVTWLVREGATDLLRDAVRGAAWWPGAPFAWVAGERTVVRDIRRHLVEDRGMPKKDIDFTGYWKRADVVVLADDAATPDPDRNTEAFQRFHDLVDLVPAIAIRVAVELGIGTLLAAGAASAAEIAARTGSDERALGKLLRYLRSIDVVAETGDDEPGRFTLTEVGDFLADDYWAGLLDPNGSYGRQAQGIFGLAESVRSGRASYASVTGSEFAQLRTKQPFEDRLLDGVAEGAVYLGAPLADSGAFEGVEHLVIRSDGAGVEAREITARHPGLRVTISALPAQADWLRRDLPASVPDAAHRERIGVIEQTVIDPAPDAAAVLLVFALGALPDDDAAATLRAAAANLPTGGRVLLIEDLFDTEQLDEHDGEADLLALTRDGTGLRTEDELRAVVALAGLREAGTRAIGWGTVLRELVTC
ncbi:siderophore-interacting protein [Pseudonocardia abyssalis]|uniref:Siderophore-interacting protein n=1 Tax=Pseudonocardia abyssalis TaxID=2792008 RepID=A0ABS6UVJ7_9PSEU|nr:siderophore-interacting protein [Pseudonocardia abyssalis]MBW0114775.1 siderophore-interacting protein [Pseudonocardia abyssalis]MBW0136283.1 siderophore-interacting protein [Pseudonocardia abyssalis]